MTPKEKAKELYYKFTCAAPLHSDNKECALIAVDEILNFRTFLKSMPLEDIIYWQEVRNEIDRL